MFPLCVTSFYASFFPLKKLLSCCARVLDKEVYALCHFFLLMWCIFIAVDFSSFHPKEQKDIHCSSMVQGSSILICEW